MVLVTGSVAYDVIMDFPGKFADHIDPTKIHILNLCCSSEAKRGRFNKNYWNRTKIN